MKRFIQSIIIVVVLIAVVLATAVYAEEEEVGAPSSLIVQTVAKHASCYTWADIGRLQTSHNHFVVLKGIPDTYKYYKLYYASLAEGFLSGYAKAQFEANPATALANFQGNYDAYIGHMARTLYHANCQQEM